MTTICATSAEAVAGIADGSTLLVGGFGMAGMPVQLIDALIDQGATDLTVVSNNAGNGDTGLAGLLAKGRVRKMICSFPRQSDSWVFDGLYRSGRIELEVVPQGTLAERLRAAGAGIGAFFCPTGAWHGQARGEALRLPAGRRVAIDVDLPDGDNLLLQSRPETVHSTKPPASTPVRVPAFASACRPQARLMLRAVARGGRPRYNWRPSASA